MHIIRERDVSQLVAHNRGVNSLDVSILEFGNRNSDHAPKDTEEV